MSPTAWTALAVRDFRRRFLLDFALEKAYTATPAAIAAPIPFIIAIVFISSPPKKILSQRYYF
jgi:hypothetical protein